MRSLAPLSPNPERLRQRPPDSAFNPPVSTGGLLIRPAVALPIERYSPERRAEFLLSNAVDAEDYADAVDEVRRMGLDPDSIPHEKPDAA